MESMLHSLYFFAPIQLQNLMMSVNGWLIYRKRYGKAYHKYVNYLMKTQWLSREDFFELQKQQLRTLIAEAVENVPYYGNNRSLYSRRLDSLSLSNMVELPLLEKERFFIYPG